MNCNNNKIVGENEVETLERIKIEIFIVHHAPARVNPHHKIEAIATATTTMGVTLMVEEVIRIIGAIRILIISRLAIMGEEELGEMTIGAMEIDANLSLL